MIEVFNVKRAAIALDLNFARFDRPAVVIAQDWHQHAVVQRFFLRFPIDVEIGGVSAGGAVFQHIPPPAIVAVRDAHVVGHHVEHLP